MRYPDGLFVAVLIVLIPLLKEVPEYVSFDGIACCRVRVFGCLLVGGIGIVVFRMLILTGAETRCHQLEVTSVDDVGGIPHRFVISFASALSCFLQ